MLWYPGLNARSCRTYRTHFDATQAARLLAGLKAAKGPVPGAIYNCPVDDGRFAQIRFRTSTGSPSFRLELSGCAWCMPANRTDLGTWPPHGHDLIAAEEAVRAGPRVRGENVGVNRPQLIVAGYVLAVPARRPPGHEQVLPEEFLTISDCLMADLPRPEFWDWFVHHGEATGARQSLAPEAGVLAVAMTPGDADGFMREHGGAEQPYFELLRTQQPLSLEVDLLGFEVVGAEWTLDFHSWHCHGYAPEACPQLGVQLNEFGLIATYEDAVKLLGWMLAQPPEHQPAPVEWTVVAIART